MRKLAIGVVIVLILAGAGWTGLWLYASNEAETRLAGWIKSEAAEGRIWTCPDQRIGGFPFAVTVDCTTPTYEARGLDRTDKVEAAALTAEAALSHPTSLAITLKAPLTYKAGADADLTATWRDLWIDLASTTARLRGDGVAVNGTFGTSGRQGGGAETLDATFTGHEDATLDVTATILGAPIAALDAVVGDTTPADITLAGRLDHAVAVDARTPEEAIDAWRRAGGRIALTTARITRGASTVTANGTLGLDEAHRPQGRLAASFVGLEPILKRYGISANLAAAGALLNTLFGGGDKPAPASAPGALDLPVVLQGGRLAIGPVRTPVQLQPLY